MDRLSFRQGTRKGKVTGPGELFPIDVFLFFGNSMQFCNIVAMKADALIRRHADLIHIGPCEVEISRTKQPDVAEVEQQPSLDRQRCIIAVVFSPLFRWQASPVAVRGMVVTNSIVGQTDHLTDLKGHHLGQPIGTGDQYDVGYHQTDHQRRPSYYKVFSGIRSPLFSSVSIAGLSVSGDQEKDAGQQRGRHTDNAVHNHQ